MESGVNRNSHMRRSADQRSPGSTLPLSTISLVSAGFVALAVAMGIGRFAFTPVLPMMRHEGALSITGAAWLAMRQLRRLPRGRTVSMAFLDPH